MTTDAVRTLIREVLAEELGRLAQEHETTPGETKEIVSITSDEDLQALVRHVLELSSDKSVRNRMVSGEHRFVLGAPPVPTPMLTPSPDNSGVVQIEKGFLSERKIEELPAGTRVVRLGRKVRFTPLARDRLRLRKIIVERIE